ncbi:MAG: DUF3006 domain-containing protein [Candidatus Aureabacteria bacterium]|jgi:hypothetical protein|nr:DUF3006 domain-containing protein [Candidatus Auribacterota bacterium]NLW93987.1 DUF3006 domain-containing protein [Chlamydiota bacterium]HOE28142.1 DUF3006 domain-containing protein [bacterium]HQM52847.1 DUF3006 domain-containing protein [bacterium]
MKVRVVVDRIEEDLAVLEVGGEGTVEWPVKFLPPELQEGNVLDVEFLINRQAEAEARAEISDLQKQLLERTKKLDKGKKA